jgi:hypothetical protein
MPVMQVTGISVFGGMVGGFPAFGRAPARLGILLLMKHFAVRLLTFATHGHVSALWRAG